MLQQSKSLPANLPRQRHAASSTTISAMTIGSQTTRRSHAGTPQSRMPPKAVSPTWAPAEMTSTKAPQPGDILNHSPLPFVSSASFTASAPNHSGGFPPKFTSTMK